MAENNWELELNEYIRQGEPDKVDKSNAWKTAIGLQDVDGLKPPAYLIETAKDHIEGKISITEADERIHSVILQNSHRKSGRFILLEKATPELLQYLLLDI